jgi:DNA-binding LytR/AlgR family response regulator
MKVVVIEDEPLARKRIVEALTRHDERAVVIAELDSVEGTVRWFSAHEAPDLVISDIELTDGTVFAALQACVVRSPIIFVTAYDQYVLQAFEDNGIAYLLKPVEDDKLAAALDKYQRLRQAFSPVSAEILEQLQRAVRSPSFRSRLVVKRRDGIQLLSTADVAYIQTREELTSAYDGQGREYPLRETLKQLEAMLDPAAFFRINRSEIVHIAFIDRLEPYGAERLQIRLRGLDVRLVSSIARTPALRRFIQG